MARSRRQAKAYTDTCDLFKPTPPFTIGANRKATDATISTTPTHADVEFHWEAKPEASTPQAPGRTNQDNIFTYDVMHFYADQEVGADWYLKLTTADHPEEGSWFVIQGDARTHMWRAGKKALYAKKAIAPFPAS